MWTWTDGPDDADPGGGSGDDLPDDVLAGLVPAERELPDEDDLAEGGAPVSESEAAIVELAAVAAVDELEHADDVAVEDLDMSAVAGRLTGTAHRVNQALVDQLRLVAQWADLHSCPTQPHPGGRRVPGVERMVALGGEGSPAVSEFAPAELGVVLCLSTDQAARLLGDVLDLRHRLPLLWQGVLAGDVTVAIARRVADQTRTLSKRCALGVDARVAAVAGRLTWRRLARIIRAATLASDPAEALTEAEAAKAETGVWVDDETTLRHGYGTLVAKAAAGDLAAFNLAIGRVAAALAILGDTDTLQQRRAKALGILAHPQQALALLDRANHTTDTVGPDTAGHEGVDGAKPADASGRGRRRRLAFDHVLYYHLSHEAVQAMLAGRPGGIGRLEDLGAVLAEQVRDWLTNTHANIVVKPVIDPDRMPAVDCWEIPTRIREAVGLVRPADYFPWSSCVTRHQDHDHVTAYQPMNRGGPPGQTTVAALARTTRRHHRIKTHGGWTVTPIRTDTWIWRSPTGHLTLVDNTGSTHLGTG